MVSQEAMSVGAEHGQEAEIEGLGLGAPASTFGKYHLFATLGRGGMADVFLSIARGPMGFNKLAVIKRLRSNLADDPNFRTMFLDEARLAARLNHPNIVHTYEVGEKAGNYFIAMEYLEGQSLNKIIREAVRRDEVFEQAFCARVVSDALAGLQSAHELRDYDGRPLEIIHRDLSPHNVFVTYGGQAKLVDFGIAKAALSSTQTEVGVLKGKVAYMSPEQAMGGAIDQRADIFTMGIVLWEFLAQKRLMSADSAASTLHRLLHLPIPAVSTVRPDVDPELDAIVAKALEKDPQFRFQTAQEMRDALDGFLASLASSTGRHVRQDEIGRKVTSMFSRVREDVQRRIQQHMAMVTQATNSEELAVLNAEAIRRGGGIMGSSPSMANLMKLPDNGGSGSGIITGYSAPGQTATPPTASVVTEKKGRAPIVVLSALVAVLAGAVIYLWFAKPEGQTVDHVTVVRSSGNDLPGVVVHTGPPDSVVRAPEPPASPSPPSAPASRKSAPR